MCGRAITLYGGAASALLPWERLAQAGADEHTSGQKDQEDPVGVEPAALGLGASGSRDGRRTGEEGQRGEEAEASKGDDGG